jgi:hypothetical protein
VIKIQCSWTLRHTHTHTSSSCIHVFALQAYVFILMFVFARLGESLDSYRLCRLVGRLQVCRIFSNPEDSSLVWLCKN